MKRLVILFGAIMIAAVPARAQDYPRGEVYAGYSFFTADVNTNNPLSAREREGFHGVGFSGAANLSKNFGIVADFSYHKKQFDVIGPNIDFSIFNFLFGPRFTARGHKVEAFGHFLVGGIRRK